MCYAEHMFHTNMRFVLSELMLHTKMCNVQTYLTHEYEVCSVRTYVTYENVMCPNLCYTRKYDVLCRNLCYIRNCVMSILLDLVNINVYTIFYQNIPNGSSVIDSLTSSEFGPRQSLDQQQMSFSKPLS